MCQTKSIVCYLVASTGHERQYPGRSSLHCNTCLRSCEWVDAYLIGGFFVCFPLVICPVPFGKLCKLLELVFWANFTVQLHLVRERLSCWFHLMTPHFCTGRDTSDLYLHATALWFYSCDPAFPPSQLFLFSDWKVLVSLSGMSKQTLSLSLHILFSASFTVLHFKNSGYRVGHRFQTVCAEWIYTLT